jgi:hypothetical protein
MESKTVPAFQKVIDSIEALYEVTFRNGWLLPDLHSSIITEKYLQGVIDGTIYCLRAEELKFRQCYAPPTKAVLIEKL